MSLPEFQRCRLRKVVLREEVAESSPDDITQDGMDDTVTFSPVFAAGVDVGKEF